MTFPSPSHWPSCPHTCPVHSHLGAFVHTVTPTGETCPSLHPSWFLSTFKPRLCLPAHQPHPQPPEHMPTCPPNPPLAPFLFTFQVTCVRPPSGSSLRPAGPILPLSSFRDTTPFPLSLSVSLPRLGLFRGQSCHTCHLSTQHRTWHRQDVRYLLSLHGIHPSILSVTRDTAVRRQAEPCSSTGHVLVTSTYVCQVTWERVV